MATQRKTVLFVDDEPSFLSVLRDILSHWAGESWEILTAVDVAEALGILQSRPVDLVVLDVQMPVVDGVQFLGLLRRAYPHLPRVVLTGRATEAERTACLEAGVQLFLEKPVTEAGWRNLYSALNEVLRLPAAEGFRGVLRAMSLQDILQMECLAHNSSVLEVSSPGCTGRVFIQAGQLVHAEAGDKRGLEALAWLLGLKGGEFSLRPFIEPPERTLTERWEFVLMEAARRQDEAERIGPETREPEPTDVSLEPPEDAQPASSRGQAPRATGVGRQDWAQGIEPSRQPGLPWSSWTRAQGQPKIDEVLLISPLGEVLFEWQCTQVNDRLRFLEFLSQRVQQLAQRLPLGQFDRWEAEAGPVRVACQMRPERTVWVRRSLLGGEAGPETGTAGAEGQLQAVQAAAARWLASVAPVRGLLALGVQFADQTTQWRSWWEGFQADRLGPAWQPVLDTLQVLKLNRLPRQRVCWVYEQAILLSQWRDDGARLSLVIANGAGLADWDSLRRVGAEFGAGA